MMHPAMRGHCMQRDIQELFWSLFKHTSYYGGVDKTLVYQAFILMQPFHLQWNGIHRIQCIWNKFHFDLSYIFQHILLTSNILSSFFVHDINEWTDNTELIWNIIVRQWTDNHLTDSAWHKSAFLLRKISVNNHSVVLFKTTISQQCEAGG